MGSVVHHKIDADGFGEVDLEADEFAREISRCSYPPDEMASWEPKFKSDIYELTVPPGQIPEAFVPDSIEAAILAVIDQVPGPLTPELPPYADRHRHR